MIKALIVLFSLSLSFASDFSADKWKQLFEQFQKNYPTFSIQDIKQMQSMIQSGDYDASARDMEEFLGEWFVEDETIEIYVTVDSDQSVPNMLALSAMVEAEGAITATGSDFEEELTYILDEEAIDDGGDEYNWACDDVYGTSWYESEDECNMYCENDCYYDDGDEEDGASANIMNMSFFEFFMLLFGMEPEGVDVPVIVGFFMDEDYDVQHVEGLMFSDEGEMLGFEADSVDLAAGAAFDSDENTITFTSLELKDSLRVTQLTLDGTIGPGTVDFEAGVPTLVPYFDGEEMFDDNEEEVYMVFNDDYTGMEIYIEEDEYSGEMYTDTADYAWWLDNDMLLINFLDGEWICNEDPDDPSYWGDEDECNDYCDIDCEVEDPSDTISFSYEFDEDTLHIAGNVYVCEDETEGYEECLQDELPIPPELRDIDDAYITFGRAMVFTGDNVSIANANALTPNQFKVFNAYPNPFNPVTTLRYQLPEANMVSVIIYDMAGKEVKTLIHQQQTAGLHGIQWNGTNNLGNMVSAGIYLYQVQSGVYNQTNKMILLK
tara:strand:- start:6699 stop:8342 length:1644 start_codon:yes stop_codon:yes gene_type:complete